MISNLLVRFAVLAVVAAHTGREHLHARRRQDVGVGVVEYVILVAGGALVATAVYAAVKVFVQSRIDQIK
ncbi:MAG: hypothetical protein QG597_4161 [Actinomycetota bacterium]|nr:hypothetical protein [Actinomycetota bacterium]